MDSATPYKWTLCWFQIRLQLSVYHLEPRGTGIGSWDSHRHAKVASPVKGVSLLLFDPSSSSVAWARDCPSLSLSVLICKVGMLTVPVSGFSEGPSWVFLQYLHALGQSPPTIPSPTVP